MTPGEAPGSSGTGSGARPRPPIRTRILRLTGGKGDRAKIAEAASVLQGGGLVVFPTETVYGLGANALSAEAVEGIFRVKGRPCDNPLIVHLSSSRELPRVARRWPAVAERLAARFWPGPLTLVLPKHPRVPSVTTAGLGTVAVRVPGHPVARRLIAAAGVPIAAPSANLSGRPSLTSPSHLVEELTGRVEVLLLGGDSPLGVESTVVDVTARPPVVLRPGGLSLERIRRTVPSVRAPSPSRRAGSSPPRSPGLRHRHYAPRARMTVYVGPPRQVWQALRTRQDELARAGVGSALLVSQESPLRGRDVWVLGSRRRPSAVARRLFSAIREADARGFPEMLVEGFPSRGLGLAVMDRLLRASEGRRVVLPPGRGRRSPGGRARPQAPKKREGSFP